MVEVDYAQIQQLYGGRYVARREGEVVASADTYDQLVDQLDRAAVDSVDLIIEYVEPADVVCVY